MNLSFESSRSLVAMPAVKRHPMIRISSIKFGMLRSPVVPRQGRLHECQARCQQSHPVADPRLALHKIGRNGVTRTRKVRRHCFPKAEGFHLPAYVPIKWYGKLKSNQRPMHPKHRYCHYKIPVWGDRSVMLRLNPRHRRMP